MKGGYIASMFEYKSNINKGNLDEIMREEFKFYDVQNKRVGLYSLSCLMRLGELGVRK